MNIRYIRLKSVDSTNKYLLQTASEYADEVVVAVADFQSAGQGMGTNTWESEPGKNLLFSILVHPTMLPINRQFLLSMAEAVALKEALDSYTDGITIKWPNDIYWNDRKISGTRIDTTLASGGIKDFVLGTGIDVNQQKFFSDAPNPVSLFQILNHEINIDELLERVMMSFVKYYGMIVRDDYEAVSALYHKNLYRGHGFFRYRDANGEFDATLTEVEDDGHLMLRDDEGNMRRYGFKEIEFLI